MRNVDDLGLENPFQHFEESEQAASGWGSFGESPFASEQEQEADSREGESLDWLDYEGEGQPCTCGASEAEAAPPAKRSREADFLGGRVVDFRARSHGGRVAVFVPAAARSSGEVDVLLFVHGLLHVCKPPPKPARSPVGLITQDAFRLGKLATDSGLPVVLVVPFFDWGNASATALAKPARLNALLQEALAQVGSPAIRRLVVAGHSRAYGILDGLAARAADPEMQQGALAKLAEAWALDTTYGSRKDISPYTSWLARNPRLTLRVFYRPGSATDGRVKDKPGRGHSFWLKRAAGRIEVVQCREGHCAVPVVRLPELLSGLARSASAAETEDYFAGDDEGLDTGEDFANESIFEAGDDEAGDDEAGDDEGFAGFVSPFEVENDEYFEPADEAEADEASWSEESGYLEGDSYAADESTFDEDEGEAESEDDYEDEQESGDDEEEHGAWRELFEDESETTAQPLPVPKNAPIAFASEPAAGAYWPIVTKHPQARVVCYQPVSGKLIGNTGRVFLAKRTGKRDGKRTARLHLGVDLFAKRGDPVFASEDGTIVAYSFFYKAKSGQKTYKVLIAHEGSGVVANYGEVRPKSLEENGLKVGSRVRAGQRIGWVSDTDMIHFETYRAGTTDTSRWWADQRAPSAILNPTQYLLSLARRGRPPGGSAATPSTSAPAPSTRAPVPSKPAASSPVASGTGPAWTALIDTGRELDAATLARIQAVRNGYPKRAIKPARYGKQKHDPKVHRGYTHSRSDKGAHNQWCRDWITQNVMTGSTQADRLAGTTFKRLLEREGGTPDLNCYDNQIVTWGTGFGGRGSLQELFVQLAPTPVGKILAEAGLVFQSSRGKPGRYHVVNLDTRRVASSNSKLGKKTHLAPLEAIRRQDSLLHVLIGVAVDPSTRTVVLQEMFRRYRAMAASFKGIEQIHGSALFSFVSHMHLWYPKFARGGLSWALTQVPSGAPTAERDLKLAGFFAHYFLMAAEVYEAQTGDSYAQTVYSRLPGNPWQQFREDRAKDGAPQGPETLPLKLGGGASYPSVDEVKRFWKSG